MKFLVSSLFLVGLIAAAPANASTTVIDFDDLTGQSAVPSDYGGLSWGPGWTYYDWAQSPYNPSSGTVRIYNNQPGATFSFLSDVLFDGFFTAGANDPISFDLYNDGLLVASSGTINTSSTPTFLASNYSGAVDQVIVNGNPGFFIIDDITFRAQAAVPEPGTWAMMLLGFGAMGWRFRRRRKFALA